MKFGLFFRVTHQSKVHTIIHPVLNASNLTNQYISYSMALFSPNEIRTFFFRVTHQSKVHTIIHPVLNASNLTNQYISYSMALFSPNEIRTF